jgi:WD40 repeat protein
VLYAANNQSAHKVCYNPVSANEIAVGGEEGLTIWRTDRILTEPNMYSWKIKNQIQIYQCSITTMKWSYDGRFIALGSYYSSYVQIYDCYSEKMYTLNKLRCTLKELVWSPKAHYLFASCLQNEFRIFETLHFTNDCWNNLLSPIKVRYDYLIDINRHSAFPIMKP